MKIPKAAQKKQKITDSGIAEPKTVKLKKTGFGRLTAKF